MNPSWKTTVCGLLGTLFLGLAQIPEFTPLAIKVFYLLGGILPNVGLLFARDNKVSSEQVGAGAGQMTLPIKVLSGLLLGGILCCGCAKLLTVKPGSDPLIVQAEWLAENSLNSVDQFLAWESQNRAALAVKPEISATAIKLRETYPDQLRKFREVTKDYAFDKSQANGDQLRALMNAGLEMVNNIRGAMGLPPLLLPDPAGPSVSDLMNIQP